MKLHYIYISIGAVTILLNLVLTLHIIGRRKDIQKKDTLSGEDIITFRLAGESRTEVNTTEAVLYDDTVVLR